MVDEDAELAAIARREAADRVSGILRALDETPNPTRTRTMYRHAHTLAGLAPDPDTLAGARRMSEILRDERGHIREPGPAEEAEVRTIARSLSERWKRSA